MYKIVTLKPVNILYKNFAYLAGIVIAFGFAASIPGCAKQSKSSGSTTAVIDSTGITTGTPLGSTATGADTGDLLANTTIAGTITITFGTTVTINNPYSGSGGVSIALSGSNVVVTSTNTSALEYVLAGTTTNGSVKIYSAKKFKLTLNGVNITSTTGPAINIQASKTAFVVLNGGTTNTLTDGPNYVPFGTEDEKATLFSEGQLVFSGTGTLNVQGNYKHAICSDDYIRVISGNITVTGSIKDGMHSNDYLIVDGGTIKITASDDGAECEAGYLIVNGGTININAFSNGLTASYTGTDTTIKPYVNINGGIINATTTNGDGIQSKSVLTINKGNITNVTYGNGLNAGTALYVNGGNIALASTGNDGMDSNGIITITGGKTVAIASNTAPRCGVNCHTKTLKITGGIVVGIGSQTSLPSATASTVHSVVLGGGTAKQTIHIEASDGTEALTFTAPTAYSTLLYSCSKLNGSTAYTVYTDGSVSSNAVTFDGLFLSGTYTKGTKTAIAFTTSSLTTQNGGVITQ